MHPVMAEDLARTKQREETERACRATLSREGTAARRHLTGSPRTLATAASIEASFAFAWFGWGQAGPSAVVSGILAAGSVHAVLVAAIAFRAARRFRAQGSPLGDKAAAHRYGMIVGAEFALAGGGAAVCGATGHAEFIAAWVCVVVGVHFVPLGGFFPGAGMKPLGAAMCVVGGAGFALAETDVLPSTVTGLGAGVCLLVHAVILLDAARQGGAPASAKPGQAPPRAEKILYRPAASETSR